MFKTVKTVTFLAFLLSVLSATNALANCENGELWIFEIEGKNPVVSRSDEAIGVYTIKCTDGKPVIQDEYVNVAHFAAVIPSVPGLTAEPPWFEFLNGKSEWTWGFDWEPPARKKHIVQKWRANFKIVFSDAETTKVVRNDVHLAGPGWRKYEYTFLKSTGSVTEMTAQWMNGTTYRLKLTEHKKAG